MDKRINMRLIGRKFNKLTIIEFAYVKKGTHWKCLCDCGKECIVSDTHLKDGHTISCGCARIYKCFKGESGLKSLYGSYKSSAKQKHLIFELTMEEFKEITSKNCAYCGIEPLAVLLTSDSKNIKLNEYRSYTYNGIDRVDSSKGYVKGNVVPCCKWCNIAKGNKTVEEFKEHIRKIYHHFLKGLGRSTINHKEPV